MCIRDSLYCACAETVFMNFRCKFRHRRSIRRPRLIIPTKFEVDRTIHCRVTAFLSADTSRDLVTSTFDLFDLEQLSCMAGHVTNHATKFEDPMTIRSWVTIYNGSHWLPMKMGTLPLRMRRITWPVSTGWKTITFLESPTAIGLFTI